MGGHRIHQRTSEHLRWQEMSFHLKCPLIYSDTYCVCYDCVSCCSVWIHKPTKQNYTHLLFDKPINMTDMHVKLIC